MYRQEKPLVLMSTASAIPNNLAVDQVGSKRYAEQIAVIHPGYVSIIPVDSEEQKTKYVAVRSSAGETVLAQVSQVMWCRLGNETWFVIASTLGIQVFDSNAEKCFFSHPCREGPDVSDAASPQLATIGADLLCVGNNVGFLYVFHLFDQNCEAVLVQHQKGHKYGISAIAGPSDATTEDIIASGDQDGNVIVWAVNRDHLHKDATFSSYGSVVFISMHAVLSSTSPHYMFACTCIHVWHRLIIVAYGSGHIRLFSVHPTAAMLVEVAAHARWITALDLAPDSGRLLSVGEDSLIRVWQIGEEQPMVEHRFYSSIRDSMLVGARFLNSNGSSFCVSAYDNCEVQCFHLS